MLIKATVVGIGPILSLLGEFGGRRTREIIQRKSNKFLIN